MLFYVINKEYESDEVRDEALTQLLEKRKEYLVNSNKRSAQIAGIPIAEARGFTAFLVRVFVVWILQLETAIKSIVVFLRLILWLFLNSIRCGYQVIFES